MLAWVCAAMDAFRHRFAIAFAAFAACASPAALAQQSDVIPRVKLSVVAVGTFQTTRVPQFRFAGTGFAVGDGTLVATNAHVLPTMMEPGNDPEVVVEFAREYFRGSRCITHVTPRL